jgi:hypothetical protein
LIIARRFLHLSKQFGKKNKKMQEIPFGYIDKVKEISYI